MVAGILRAIYELKGRGNVLASSRFLYRRLRIFNRQSEKMEITKSKINEVGKEIKSMKTEAFFTSRWVVIEFYHQVGKLLNDNFEELHPHLSALTKTTGIGERNLYRAAKLHRDYPNLNLLPQGKNVSWNKLINEHLLESGEKKEEKCHHCFLHCPKI